MSEQVHFEGKFLRLTTEEKDGIRFERAYQRNGVSVIVEPKPKVLRFAYGSNWKYKTPQPLVVCGYLEKGESPLECAKRELDEEMGATAAHWQHFMTSEWIGTVIKKQEYFIAKHITQGAARPEADEKLTGYLDMSFSDAKQAVLELKFGTNENAFALLKYINENE